MFNKIKLLSAISFSLLLAGCATTPETDSSNDVEKEIAPNADNTKPLADNDTHDIASGDSHTIYFAFDSNEVSASQSKKIDAQVEAIKAKPKAKVSIEGHTDYIGTREYNIALGERRANAVKNAILEDDSTIDANRINIVSYGKDRPIDDGRNSRARAKNRRAVTSK